MPSIFMGRWGRGPFTYSYSHYHTMHYVRLFEHANGCAICRRPVCARLRSVATPSPNPKPILYSLAPLPLPRTMGPNPGPGQPPQRPPLSHPSERDRRGRESIGSWQLILSACNTQLTRLPAHARCPAPALSRPWVASSLLPTVVRGQPGPKARGASSCSNDDSCSGLGRRPLTPRRFGQSEPSQSHAARASLKRKHTAELSGPALPRAGGPRRPTRRTPAALRAPPARRSGPARRGP
jgi:hypothetical protein